MLKIAIDFLVVFSFFGLLHGQQLTVEGTVTAKDTGEPLRGVNIQVKDSDLGTTTDIEGGYSLDGVPSDGVLVFFYIDYETVEISVNGRSTINVDLLLGVLELESLVVTGYRTERKVDLTGAISVVDLEEITDITKSNPLTTLQGRVPGLFIEQSGRPSGEIGEILIRGRNTLNNNSPLFIIDGVPTTSATAFSILDVNSIASIQVLKDASAAAIYGSRGANGVIIVTTK